MTDLVDEVRGSFEHAREMDPNKGPIAVVRDEEMNLPPGFSGMRLYYEAVMLKIARRGYRHFAGGTRPTQADELLEQTAPVMMPLLIDALFSAFADGVRIGHQDDHLVRMCFHYNTVDTLFNDPDFRAASMLMAAGFKVDTEVLVFFTEYATGGLAHLAHLTGFVHTEVEPGKVWDLWLLLGSATYCAAYLAGHTMGSGWRERDVLTGIEIATEEGGDGS